MKTKMRRQQWIYETWIKLKQSRAGKAERPPQLQGGRGGMGRAMSRAQSARQHVLILPPSLLSCLNIQTPRIDLRLGQRDTG